MILFCVSYIFSKNIFDYLNQMDAVIKKTFVEGMGVNEIGVDGMERRRSVNKVNKPFSLAA